jgi:hypothetical protein
LGRRGRDRQRLWPLLRRLFALEGYAFFAKTGSGRQRCNNAVRQPVILSSFGGGLVVVLILILDLTRHDGFRNQAGILAYGGFDLGRNVGVLF